MSDSPNQISRADVEDLILAKVAEDPAFAASLKADPKAVLSEMFGTKLPADLQISVFQETPTHLMLRLPGPVSDELSDSVLEGVAGGLYRPIFGGKWPGGVRPLPSPGPIIETKPWPPRNRPTPPGRKW
jgi:hypothetical protein